jgi:hypothetical protein
VLRGNNPASWCVQVSADSELTGASILTGIVEKKFAEGGQVAQVSLRDAGVAVIVISESAAGNMCSRALASARRWSLAP